MNLNQIVEALLFASPDPLGVKSISKIVRDVSKRDGGDAKLAKTTTADVETAISELNDTYEKDAAAFMLEERASGWKFYTRSDYGEFVRELYPAKKAARLSPPALETLAIVAYRQPLTKAAIEAVRGVSVDGVLQTLIERGLVHIGGRADLPGRPLLYQTTDSFLDHFGITGVDELPNAAELRQVELPQPKEETVNEEEQLSLAGVDNGQDGDDPEGAEDAPQAEGEGEREVEAGAESQAEADAEVIEPEGDKPEPGAEDAPEAEAEPQPAS